MWGWEKKIREGKEEMRELETHEVIAIILIIAAAIMLLAS